MFNQSHDLIEIVSRLENVSYNNAEDLVTDEIVLLKSDQGRDELGKIKYWLLNKHLPQRRPKAFHGKSFKSILGSSGYDQADELFQHVFVDHGFKTMDTPTLYRVYKGLEIVSNPKGRPMAKRDFIEQMKRWVKNNLGVFADVKKTTCNKHQTNKQITAQLRGSEIVVIGSACAVPRDRDWFEVVLGTNEYLLLF